jgi:hypothetical protein
MADTIIERFTVVWTEICYEWLRTMGHRSRQYFLTTQL